MNVLSTQPEVDPKRISLIGHSEGTVISPRVAIDNPTKVKNIILMGTVSSEPSRFTPLSNGIPTRNIR